MPPNTTLSENPCYHLLPKKYQMVVNEGEEFHYPASNNQPTLKDSQVIMPGLMNGK